MYSGVIKSKKHNGFIIILDFLVSFLTELFDSSWCSVTLSWLKHLSIIFVLPNLFTIGFYNFENWGVSKKDRPNFNIEQL